MATSNSNKRIIKLPGICLIIACMGNIRKKIHLVQ